MDISLNFSSDSTFCSLYEDIKQSGNKKHKPMGKQNESKFLDKIHNKIILHFEGKVLIGRIEVVQYMKLISKMKFNNPNHEHFANKIRVSLLKIYNLTKQFESSYSTCNETASSDPDLIDDFSFSQDLKNSKQILFQTSNTTVEESFPIEILTNDNFMSLPQIVSTAYDDNLSIIKDKFLNEARFVETKSNGMDRCSSELFSINSEKNLKGLNSLESNEKIMCKDISSIHQGTLNLNNVCNSTQKQKMEFNSEAGLIELSRQGVAIKQNSATENFMVIEHDILKITELSENINFENKISDIKIDKNNVINVDLKTVNDLENLFKEFYNTKVYKICSDIITENENKSWQEIDHDVTNNENSARKAQETLKQLFEKLFINENSNEIIPSTQVEENIHRVQDSNILDIEALKETNKVKLKEICKEFSVYLYSRPNKSVEDEGDFKVLNWRKLV